MNQTTFKTKLQTAATTAGAGLFVYDHIWRFNSERWPTYPVLLFERFERELPDKEYYQVEVDFFVFHEYKEGTDDVNAIYDNNDTIAEAFRVAVNADSSLQMGTLKADDGDWKSINADEGTKYTAQLKIYC